MVECIDYARISGAKIMSNSWGGGGYSVALLDAIRRARDADISFIAAAGNNFANIEAEASYPASCKVDNLIVVAASTSRDELAGFSNYSGNAVHLAAPGNYIYSTYARSGSSSDSEYEYMSGTSQTTPHVSGAMALLRAQFPTESSIRLTNRLLNSTRSIPALAGKTITGGVLNLASAVTSTNYSPLNNLRAAAWSIGDRGHGANFRFFADFDG